MLAHIYKYILKYVYIYTSYLQRSFFRDLRSFFQPTEKNKKTGETVRQMPSPGVGLCFMHYAPCGPLNRLRGGGLMSRPAIGTHPCRIGNLGRGNQEPGGGGTVAVFPKKVYR